MGRTKGIAKTGGRKKGTKNKRTAINRAYIEDFLQRHSQDFETAFSSLEERDACNLYVKLLEFVTPKAPQSIEANVSADGIVELKFPAPLPKDK